MCAIDKIPELISRFPRNRNYARIHQGDNPRYFSVSEPSSDLGRNPDATSVLQAQAWRYVYARHLAPGSEIAGRLQVLGAEPRDTTSWSRELLHLRCRPQEQTSSRDS